MNLSGLGKWFQRYFGGGDEANESMTAERALSYAPVWHCVSKITGAFMIMELELLRMRAKSREVQDNHAAHILVSERPNEYQTAPQFKRQMMMHALLWGNARAYIRRENGVPVELIPILPDRSDSAIIDGEKWHGTLVRRDDRIALFEPIPQEDREKVMYFRDSEVWHIPGLGFDGVKGYSLIEMARRSWSIGIGHETHLQKQQKKGYAGGLMLEAPQGAFRSAADAQEFLKHFREQHEGADNAGRVGMLRENIKANVLAMNNNDAQFIEQRRFQREDTALLFCLEGILGDSSNSSYNSLHQKNLAYRVNCLSPWTVAIEHECNRKLLSESERRRGYRFKHDDRTLLRMDTQTLMSVISQAINARVLSPNEGRELLDYNPYEGGDVYLNPAIDKQQGESSQQSQSQSTEQRATQAMLGNLIGVECKRVTGHSGESNFLSWMDNFYAAWESKLADGIEQLGGDREIATEYCVESRRRLLDASECKPEELPESVAKCVESWPNRVHSLIEEIQLCLK
jgi:HK97 family phage portal protein